MNIHGKNSLTSPTFSSATNDKVKWYLYLRLKDATSDEISLFLFRSNQSTETSIRAMYSFSFIDSERKLLKKYTSVLRTFSSGEYEFWGWNGIKVRDVVSPDNTLNIVCDIAICEYSNNVVYRNRVDTISKIQHNRSQDIVPSVKKSQLPDVILVLSKNGKEYPAKKAILAASSPVFATMLKYAEQREKKIERFTITDVDEPVFDEILRYIYTGKCENIEKYGHGLLVAAHKYELNQLKTICIEEIRKRLTVGNVIDTLLLADKYGFNELKSDVIRFIIDNYIGMIESKSWNYISHNDTYSKLVREVMEFNE